MKKLFIAICLSIALLSACSSVPKPKSVTLSAQDIIWDPPLIEAQVGQEVQLTIRNDGVLDHNFVSKDLGFNVLVAPGESQTLSFVRTQSGTVDFICNIPGHEEAGMVGEFVISE